jgi:hypothetical protein
MCKKAILVHTNPCASFINIACKILETRLGVCLTNGEGYL